MINATNVLVALNILVFIWLSLTGGSTDGESLIAHGGMVPLLVWRGEWWRMVSSGFLHSGLLHIALNMVALLQVGTYFERLVGPRRLLIVYALSLIGSGFAVLYFSQPTDLTVGASGAIFGVFGALVAVGVRLGRDGRILIQQTLPIIVLNLALGFSIANISNAGHIGGLITGFLSTLLIVRVRRVPVPVEDGSAGATDASADENAIAPASRASGESGIVTESDGEGRIVSGSDGETWFIDDAGAADEHPGAATHTEPLP
jgi:membrane associated rhomboid family serine protease